MRRIGYAVALLLALLFPVAGLAQVDVELVSTRQSIQPGQPVDLALRMRHDEGWHSFWKYAGTGLPTRIAWRLPPGWHAGAIRWPTPTLVRDKQGVISGHGYEGLLYLPVRLRAAGDLMPGDRVTLRATVRWLMCKTICIPGSKEVAITLPVSAHAPPANQDVVDGIAGMSMPEEADDWELSASRDRQAVTLNVAAPREVRSPHFYPLDKFIDYRKPQTVANRDRRAMLKIAVDPDAADAPAERLRGVLAYTDADGVYRGVEVDIPFSAKTAVAADGTVGSGAFPGGQGAAGGGPVLSVGVVLLAMLGGLILNLMPCVFPVLGIKVLGFVEQAGRESRRVATHAGVFSLGVMLSFWALAGALAVLRVGGRELGWGFQLQSPGFVFALAVVMLVFALNLSGVFEFGLRATSVGSKWQTRRGLGGSFFAGVLATVVATPCSAPFLAPALGVALTLPTGQSFVVFTAIALGLCLPYLVLAARPSLVRFLPRPGAWMETFKQLMAFPLYATMGYLVWVLAGQTEAYGLLNALLALALAALAAWVYGRLAGRSASRTGRGVATGAALLLFTLSLGFGWPRPPAPDGMQWQPWSPERVSELLGEGHGIYVDFTARWCATCQVNKKVVFGSEEVRKYFRDHEIVALKADWTNADPRITRELARYQRSAVPFNLVYPAGASRPVVLPEVLTPAIVLDALRQPPR